MRRTVFLLLLLTLVVAVGYPDVWLWSAHPPGDDDLEFVVPFSVEAVAALREGRLPAWNPSIDGGVSFFARFPYLEPFYPGVALFALLPPRAALDLSMLLHLLLAAGGAAFLARSLGARAPAALVAGLVYVHSSAFRANVGEGYLTALVAFVWWPWMLAALGRAVRAEDARSAAAWVGAGGAALGAMGLGGQPTDLIACALLTAVLVAAAAPGAIRRHGARRLLACCGGVVVLGAALGAAFWWPALKAVALAGGPPELPMKGPRGGAFSDLPTYLVPHRNWGSSFDRHLSFPALALVAASAVGARGRAVALLAAMGAAAFVLSLGQATPLWAALRAIVPLFDSVDTSVAYISGLALAVAVIAALAFDRLASRPARAIVVALLLLDALVYQGPAWRRPAPAAAPDAAANRVERFLVEREDGGRLLPLEMELPEERMLFQRNEVMSLGLESVRISSHFPSLRTTELLGRAEGLLLDWRDFSDERARLRQRDAGEALLEPTNARILDLFSVRRVVTDLELSGLGSPVLEVGPWRVYERPSAWARPRLLDREVPPDGPGCVDRLLDPAFDPAAGALPQGDVRLLARAAGRLRVEVSTPVEALLWLGESYDPGWRVAVDGRAASVLPVHCAFAGVEVPAGTHAVELRFVPRALYAGLATSALGLLALAALVTPALRARCGRSRATASTGRP